MVDWEGGGDDGAEGLNSGDRTGKASTPTAIRGRTKLSVQVVGAGTVGVATGLALDEWGHDVTFKDTDPTVRDSLAAEGHDVVVPPVNLDVGLSVVCVPTPWAPDQPGLSMDYVEEAVRLLATQDSGVIAIRSTVMPGTTERLATKYDLDHYAAVPEFLFADSALEDLLDAGQILLGAGSGHALRTVKAAFGSKTTFVESTPTEAEFAKLASNCFAATKISFANEMWRLAAAFDRQHGHPPVDPETVLAGFRQLTPWTGAGMGLEGGWPYGGHCLPKDTRGFRGWATNSLSQHVPQLTGTIAENDLISERAPERTADQADEIEIQAGQLD